LTDRRFEATDRRRVETSLRLQADLFEQVEVALLAADADRKLTQWNRAAEQLLGIPRSEALGRTMVEIIDIPPESQKQRAEMGEQLTAGRKWEGELTLYGAAGRKFPAYATNAPVRDADGNLVGYAGVIMDLSEMKAARAELQRHAEEQAAIATLSRAAMSSDGLEELMEQAARAVAETLAVEFVDVIELKSDGVNLRLRAGLGHDGVSSGEEADLDAATQVAHTLAVSEPVIVEDYSRERRFKPSLGQPGHEARSGATVVVEGGDQAYGVLGVYSARSRAFSAKDIEFLQSVANVLAAALARQRAQRLESRLHQNQRLEAVGRLAGGVAHDFNNLLAVILNYAAFLGEGIDDEAQQADLREITTAAERAAELTRQLLVFSRREVAAAEAVDLNEAVLKTDGVLRHSLRENVELVRNCAEGLWSVCLGPGQAEQILVNLFVNAADAMPEGGTVEVKTENLELGPDDRRSGALGEGRYVRLTVADSGSGMEEEVAAQAFDPFFTTKKDDGGTGLGLATVYGVVKEAGGDVEIDSELGQGTALKIYLPAIAEETRTPTADRPSPRAAAGETILLVEDEESVRKLAERILTRNDYRVFTAVNGENALDLARRHEGDIDLLLTDVVMPHLSGPQLVRELREVRPRLRALFMSGYTGKVISRQSDIEEGVALLEKPFDSDGLLQAVSAALHGKEDGEPNGRA
jgi:PAS domain S-box-containing protein